MPEEYIGKREFDGFGGAVREEFKQLRGDLTQVSAKIDMLLNGKVSWFPLTTNWADAFIWAPALDESVVNGLSANARDFGPLRNACGSIPNRYNNVVPTVPTLFRWSCPSAIIRAITFAAINSINRM